ncbi:ion channel [Acaryochloris marina]|uniref:ion channel n=1 Tax=Acaryochloris marina TaxID=155978 RepID=UPI0021C38A30|nr:ion channel [Acaryochloris marina]
MIAQKSMYFITSSQRKYRQLLIILILNFVASPFLHGFIGNLVSAFFLLYMVIVIIRSFTLPQKLRWAYVAIAFLAFLLQISIRLGWNTTVALPFSVMAQTIYILYLGIAAILIIQEIFSTKMITMDTIRGGICAYLLIGFVWALFYGIVETFNPLAFSETLIKSGTFLWPLHFSFTTLTTLGYGDIVPVSSLALVLTDTEAIIGQLYPSILIALLVGGYLSQKVDEK